MREWLIVRHSPSSGTTVTCTRVIGTLVVRWTVKCFASTIPQGICEARQGADNALKDLEPTVGS